MKRNAFLILFFFYSSLLTISIKSQDLTFFEQNKFTISEVKFKGLDDSNNKQKDERWWLFEKETRPLFQLLSKHKIKIEKGSPIDTKKIEICREVLRNWLYRKGFQTAQVSVFSEKVGQSKIQLIFSIERGEKIVVSDIKFEGNKNIPATELLQVLKDSMKNTWQFWDERKYEYYVQRDVREYLFSKGYLKARLGFTYQQNKDLVNITINVSEGTVYRLGKVKIEGLNVFSKEQFQTLLGQKEGDVINGKNLREFLYDKLNSFYKNRGYLLYDAEIEPEYIQPQIKAQNGIVNLKIIIDEGKQFTIRKIKIVCPELLKIQKIRKILGLIEGEIYSQEKLELGIKRINELKEFRFIDKDKDVEMRTDEESDGLYLVVKIDKK